MGKLFSDKASVILRNMLANTDKNWVARDFEISKTRSAEVLAILRKHGFISGISRGRTACSNLINREALLEEWTKWYNFERNKYFYYYSPDKKVLEKLKKYFNEKKLFNKYGLTLHTGANLITNYVSSDIIYLYLDAEIFEELSLDIRQTLDFKKLGTGGNICFIKSFYKKSVFINKQIIKGFSVVSNLQLYLDLYGYPQQRGREHAKYLFNILKEKGEPVV